jgi:hypothetical protein
MSPISLVVAVPARGSRDWRGRSAWGRDAHLMQALMHRLDPGSELVMLLRTRRGGRARRSSLMVGGVRATTIPHSLEIPGWTRRRIPAALARRWASRTPGGVPDSESGLVVCFDLMRHEAAWRLARERGWPLVTDLMDDWRRHDSMPAWHRHLEETVFPRIGAHGVLTSATALAASPHPALVVPNAGFHEWDPASTPRTGPARPVAAFLGTIHKRIDCELLVQLRRDLPDWDVVAAGPVMDADVARRLTAGGVRLEPWWEMADIDSRATVAIAPYVRSHFTFSGDPLKVYEATARGVPCVTTIPVNAPPAVGLSVVDPAGFTDAVLAARGTDRSEVMRAARATGSWEDRATMILGALSDPLPVAEPLIA